MSQCLNMSSRRCNPESGLGLEKLRGAVDSSPLGSRKVTVVAQDSRVARRVVQR